MSSSIPNTDMEHVRCHPEQPGSHKQLVRIVEQRVLSAGCHDNPSVWLLIDAMRKDAVMATTDIERDGRGEPPRKRVKEATRALQLRLQRICVARRDNQKTVEQTLSAADHTIRFA